MTRAQVIGGSFGSLLARQKDGRRLELGELLVCDGMLLQVNELLYGSQISQQNLEMVSGMALEEGADVSLISPELRAYTLARLRLLLGLDGRAPKELPGFMSVCRDVTASDLGFLVKPATPLLVGKLRSGSRVIDLPLYVDGAKAFAHHILITATTGRGKSNLLSCMLWDATGKDYCGVLVLDPHDEYYGRVGVGLRSHPSGVVYYTAQDVPPGGRTLRISLDSLRPWHFNGVAWWSEPQQEALSAYYRMYGSQWVTGILLRDTPQGFQEGTVEVLKRRMMGVLDVDVAQGGLVCRGVFDSSRGETTVRDIVSELESGKTVIVDTSPFGGQQELLIGSMVSWELLHRYQGYKRTGELAGKPVISIVLEEAPRVLGKDVLERGSNVFSTIAREGRKFKIGLLAVTQMPSLIPRTILANMNTKIILGMEMKPERDALIDSAAQDLSSDERAIASLSVGEAIVSSTFTRFAVPVKADDYRDVVAREEKDVQVRRGYMGVGS
ncbi:hypothetical protein AUJ68_04330 [Candidatus Woesearchaeota archaeon CG1_02_57_44]|nr:MAG: hypothetical protein AUJ68_04330 [Candidatus Woesearchaeota archaeon CG1_02_57_44]